MKAPFSVKAQAAPARVPARDGIVRNENAGAEAAIARIDPQQPKPTMTRFEVLGRVVDLIADRALPLGQFTSELQLAELLGLPGRTPSIREALALLARDGIVQPYPQRGYLVPGVSRGQAEEVLVLRLSVFKAIATRLTEADPTSKLAAAEGLSGKLEGLGDQAFLKAETAFWNELARQAGFIFAIQNLSSWSDQLRVFYASQKLSSSVINETVGHYRQLLKNIAARSGTEAIVTLQKNYDLRRAALSEVELPAQASAG